MTDWPRPAHRVLITGGHGFIGRHLLTALDEIDGLVVLAPMRDDMPCDDADAVKSVFATFQPNSVVHLSASLDRGPDAEEAQWRHTFDAGRIVVAASNAHSVEHLIAAGTFDEYGPDGHHGKYAPVSMYGLCKGLVRQVAEHAARVSGLAVDWFRPPIVYGPGQTGSMLVPYACSRAVQGAPLIVSDGTQRREFLYVSDIVDWLVRCLRSGPSRGLTEHDLHTGTMTEIREVLAVVQTQFPTARIEYGGQPRRAGEYDPTEAAVYRSDREILRDWRPSVTVVDGVSATASWWRDSSQRAKDQ